MITHRIIPGLAAAALLLLTVAAFAADLDQAKRDGIVGERADGYLGIVVQPAPADIVALVAEINAKRKAEYQRIANANNITLEQVEALAGRKTIEKTRTGDWILVDDTWRRK